MCDISYLSHDSHLVNRYQRHGVKNGGLRYYSIENKLYYLHQISYQIHISKTKFLTTRKNNQKKLETRKLTR